MLTQPISIINGVRSDNNVSDSVDDYIHACSYLKLYMWQLLSVYELWCRFRTNVITPTYVYWFLVATACRISTGIITVDRRVTRVTLPFLYSGRLSLPILPLLRHYHYHYLCKHIVNINTNND